MKLIYIANARIPTERAHGIQIMQMCEAFAGLGNEVELVLPKRGNWIKDDPFSYYGVAKTFKIRKLPCLDLIPFHGIIGHLGLWVETATFIFFTFPYVFFKKADIIYTRDKSFSPLALFRKNVILEIHDFPRKYFLYAPFFKRLKGAIVITKKLKDLYVEKGMRDDKMSVVPDGVDLKKVDMGGSKQLCRERLGLPINKKIVLYAGHLYDWKGVQTLFDASEHLLGNAEVYFVGGTVQDINKFKIQNSNLKIIVSLRDNISSIIAGTFPANAVGDVPVIIDTLILIFEI